VTVPGDPFDAVVDGAVLRCTLGHSSGGVRNQMVDSEARLDRLLAAR